MKRIFLIFLLSASVSAAAQCLSPDFFSNTYSFVLKKGVLNYGCHAVRLNTNWFLTSAHCVAAAGNGDAQISFNGGHDVTARIFIKDAFLSSQAPSDDLALIQASDVFSPPAKSVTLITFDADTYGINGTFSAAFTAGGGVAVSCIKGTSVYLNEKRDSTIAGLYLGPGYSGGGVWDQNGNLMGIVSGGAGGDFVYASFNADNMDFIRSHVWGLNTKSAKSFIDAAPAASYDPLPAPVTE